jgi:nitroimidazol reductase NimA-like FMN-containing flavoprotein (pyridoxamine 5'-phosphate oxidase superfamily)
VKKKAIPHEKHSGQVAVAARLRALDRQERHGVLATESGGQPYTSLVAYALSPDLTGVLFATPRETQKHRNIMKNPKVSLLINTRTNTAEDYLQAEAVTVIGLARSILPGKQWEALAGHFLHKHPDLTEFVRSPTSALVLVAVMRYIHVGRFQEVSEWAVQT